MDNPLSQCLGSGDLSGNSASAQVGGRAFTLSSSPLDLGYWNFSQWIQMESEAKTSRWGFLGPSDC